ncbi:MAG: RHS repeat protein [Nitrospiraceae bacterium]|nr:RHS repeat protein [Nitrospiraceae bacterium]
METQQEGSFLKRIHEVSGGILRCLLTLSFLTICPSLSGASSVQYIYDNLGRLIMTVSGSGTKIIYGYDAAGRVISVTRTSENQQAPVLTGINPQNAFIGTQVSLTISGSNLLTTTAVKTNNPNIQIINFTASNNSVTIQAQIQKTATVGPATLTITTQSGSADITLNLISLSFTPSLIVLTSGASQNITAHIEGLTSNYNLILKNQNPGVILAPQSVTVPVAGSATFIINALSQGNSAITAGNSGLSVFVSAPFTGAATASSNAVSVSWPFYGSASSQAVSVQMPIAGAIVVSQPVCVKISN